MPTTMREQMEDFEMEASTRDLTEESANKGKSMLQSAHETVAKALGGGSRGELVPWLYSSVVSTD